MCKGDALLQLFYIAQVQGSWHVYNYCLNWSGDVYCVRIDEADNTYSLLTPVLYVVQYDVPEHDVVRVRGGGGTQKYGPYVCVKGGGGGWHVNMVDATNIEMVDCFCDSRILHCVFEADIIQVMKRADARQRIHNIKRTQP